MISAKSLGIDVVVDKDFYVSVVIANPAFVIKNNIWLTDILDKSTILKLVVALIYPLIVDSLYEDLKKKIHSRLG